jgi:Carboxypeptidase regulatory-like domain
MIHRTIRTTGVCLVALTTLGLTACDIGPVVLEGTLTHAETGAALDGIPVRVYSSTEENVVVARARTGEDGSYRVRSGSLGEGRYRVRFSTDRWWEDGDSWGTATDVAVSAGQPARLDAALVPAMTRVWGETSCCGGAQEGVRVDAFHADTGALVATTHSEDWLGQPDKPLEGCTGCYELELPAGDIYTFRAEHPTFGWTTSWFWRDGGPARGFGVELSPGEQQVSLFLAQQSLFSGRVVDTGGSPIPGARVLAVPSRDPVPPTVEETTTGADGTFRLDGLQVVFYKLLVVGPDGTWTLAGMVNGDPTTATEFLADFTGGDPIDVGHITLGVH